MQVQDFLGWAAYAAIACNAVTLAVILDLSSSSKLRLPGITLVRRLAGEIVVLLTIGAMLGSLYISEIGNLIPCRYCWIQRIAMYPLALILSIAWLTRDKGVRKYAVPLSVGGLAFSSWHYLLHVFPSLEESTACNLLNPCTIKYIWKFGFVSIPYMAASVFLLVTLLLVGYRNHNHRIG
ncbi:MAG: disulfide bond formation protein B [Actinomycetota bacterium]|nr:disulfide bond formation protein B [Acidimicrobiales bacterium]